MFMFELFLLILLVTIIVLSIRSGKSVVLDEPIIIHRPGQYHITLAPQLNLAQTFIEQIAKQFALSYSPQGNIPSQYFEVRDPQASAQGGTCYLLAIAWRGGMLYFQAINPQPSLHNAEGHLKTLREFSEAVLALHPLTEPVDAAEAEHLRATVDWVANQSMITVKILEGND